VQVAGSSRYALSVIVCVATIAGLVLTPRLWLSSGRLYPTVPLTMLPALPPAAETALFAGLVLALLAAIVRPGARWPAVCAVVLMAAFVLWDESRLQPWVYVYAALLLLNAARAGGPAGDAAMLATARFVLAATYFWSGALKANYTFAHQTWIEFLGPLLRVAPAGVAEVLRNAGFVVPVFECAIGCALLTPRFRRLAVAAAVLLHATILGLLIAAGENTVVWPWNVAMPLLTILLFWRADTPAKEIVLGRGSPLHWVFVVLLGFMPALNLVDLWPADLSVSLYAGRIAQAVVTVEPSAVPRLPPIVQTNTWQRSLPMFIDLNRWSYEELNVPLYPDVRVFKRLGRTICRTYGEAASALLILHTPDLRTGQRRRERLECRDPSW
jgi:hypothetical protein